MLGLGYIGMRFSGMGQAKVTMIISGILSLIALIGFICVVRQRMTLAELLIPMTLMVVVLWPWWPFRLVLPLAPLFLFYLVTGLAGITKWLRHLDSSRFSDEWFAPRMFMMIVIALHLYDHSGYLAGKLEIGNMARPAWINESEEVSGMISFINENVPRNVAVAGNNPALIHLSTGHKTIFSDLPEESWEQWKKLNVQYVFSTSAGISPLPSSVSQNHYQVVYESPRLRLRVAGLGLSATRSSLVGCGQVKINSIPAKAPGQFK